ncbi:DUF4351 domain-containing protein [Floridanema evergladense]|uniref:DUF4351 domain-containing protein n=1 Tax=Floridaenema evergladense BLCC-F167 TaxID=3153639 RepID=A0ABV4WRQ5_9CYAN
MRRTIATIMVYKFSDLSRQEVEAMLGLQLKESRVYREAKEEGRQEGRQEGLQEEAFALVLRLLTRKFGTIDEEIRSQLSTLPVTLLEDLAEALLDFDSVADLPVWLETHRP